MRYSIYPILVLILAVSSSLSAGAIHKWVDDKGNIHYSDSPPAKTKSENVRVQSAPSDPGKALPRLNDPDSSEQTAGNEQEVSDERAAQICASAQADLDVISNSARIQLQSADGNLRYLSDKEIAKRKASSKADVDRFCN